MEYKAVYKCRLCGEVFHGNTADEELAKDFLEVITHQYYSVAPLPTWPTEMHRCSTRHTRSLGLGDFLGWEMEA